MMKRFDKKGLALQLIGKIAIAVAILVLFVFVSGALGGTLADAGEFFKNLRLGR